MISWICPSVYWNACQPAMKSKLNQSLSSLFVFYSLVLKYKLWESWWPHDWCTCLQIVQSGFEPLSGTLCCVLEQTMLFSVPLFTQVYKCIPVNLIMGVTLRWTSISSRGEYRYSWPLHAAKPQMGVGLMGQSLRAYNL